MLLELLLRSRDAEKKGRFLVHGLQLPPNTQIKKQAYKRYVTLQDEGSSTQAFRVEVSNEGTCDTLHVFYCRPYSKCSVIVDGCHVEERQLGFHGYQLNSSSHLILWKCLILPGPIKCLWIFSLLTHQIMTDSLAMILLFLV